MTHYITNSFESFRFPHAGIERQGSSAGFLDLLLHKLYACVARSRVSGEKIQRYAGKLLFFAFRYHYLLTVLKFQFWE